MTAASSSTRRRRPGALVAVLVAALATATATGGHVPFGMPAVSMAAPVASAGAATGTTPAGLHPADIADAYGLTGGLTGGTVAVVIPFDTPTLEDDLAVFRAAFDLPPCTTGNGCFRKTDQRGGTSYPASDVEWSLEASLDVQAVSASCPACRILVVEAANQGTIALGTAVNTAVALGAQAVSMSWGARERGDAADYSRQYFTHAGVALVAATGDDGYPQAWLPAVLPGVIAVGGTTLSRTTAAGAAQQAAAARDAVVVSDGDVVAAVGMTAAQEHVAALERARAAQARGQAAVGAAARAAAAAQRTAAVAKTRLAAATRTSRAAAEAVRRHRSAASVRARAAAERSSATRRIAARRATAHLRTRTRTVATTARALRALTASVVALEAVVHADRVLAAPSGGPVPAAPIAAAPVATTSTPVVSSPPTPSSAPEAPQPVVAPVTDPTTSTPVVTAEPAPVGTTSPGPVVPVATATPNTAPTASFRFRTTGLTIDLDGSASSDPDGAVVDRSWTFGDGGAASGATASHTYAASGTYAVALVVTDDRGASTTATASVTVTAPPAPVVPSATRGDWMETAWSGAGSGCSAVFAKPAWQTDTACTTRTVADVAAVADPSTGLAVYDTSGTAAAGYTSSGWLVMGGTSLAAPLIAGMIVRSGHAADYSDAGPLYANRTAFRDVTAGSNGNCSGAAVCTAGTGYDGPTGLGTPRSLASF